MRLYEIGAKNDMPYGWASSTSYNIKIREMWKGMLRRCYTEECGSYWKDCTVHPDFLLLSNFVKWVEQEPNYNEFCKTCDNISWSIDKDSIISGNKEYAPGKIRLITNSDNVKDMWSRYGYHRNNYKRLSNSKNTKAIIGVSIKDKTIIFYKSLKDAHKDGFKSVGHCLKGNYKQHKGYKWYYSIDLLGVMNYLYKEVIENVVE